MNSVNVRVEYDDRMTTLTEAEVEEIVIHRIVAECDLAESVVALRNNGFGHMMPVESTRQER